jgi:hypothetical protein
MSPGKALPITARAYAILLKSHSKQGLIALYNFAQRSDVDLAIASIDEQVPYSITNPLDGAYMRKVYNIGHQKALEGRIWTQQPKFTISRNPAIQ